MAKTYLSPAAFEAMKKELKDLLDGERPQVVAQVSAAAALGDRSENAEYIYGKRRLREIDRRARFLQKKLQDVEIISSAEVSSEEVHFGTWVKIRNEAGEERSFQIVGPDEMDSSGEKVTFTSPLGRALLGKKAGSVVSYLSPRGLIEVKILNLSISK